MLRHIRLLILVLLFTAGAALSIIALSAVVASTAGGVDEDVYAALKKLYVSTPACRPQRTPPRRCGMPYSAS